MLTFEQTLSQLQGWLNEPIVVTVHPETSGPPLQVATLWGRLINAEEAPDEVRSLMGTPSEDTLFFFLADEEGHLQSCFALAKSMFESASFVSTDAAPPLLTIELHSVHLLVMRSRRFRMRHSLVKARRIAHAFVDQVDVGVERKPSISVAEPMLHLLDVLA